MATAPLIGVLLDYCDSGSFSRRPHYALRRHYFDALRQAGAVAVALPAETEGLEEGLSRLDGLLVPGGFFPSPPQVYVDFDPTAQRQPVHPRAGADLNALIWALAHRVPVLGICAGMQGLAVAAGCRMVRDVHAHTGTTLDHLNGAPAEQRYHGLDIAPGTRLRALLGRGPISVNSAHREAVVEVPTEGVVISARCTADQVIEAIEIPDHPFAVGVQWHPEFFLDPAEPDAALFRALVSAARYGA